MGTSGAQLSMADGKVLATLMHLFWLNDEKYARHVQMFNHRQRDFHWEQVLEEVLGIAQKKKKRQLKDAMEGAYSYEGKRTPDS